MVTPGAGQALPHESAHKHVTGQAPYTDDGTELVGELHIAPVLAPIACGTLDAVDASAALACHGVVGVYTAADIPGRNDVAPVFDGDPLLADGTIRYHGQVVAIVAATSLATARQAARLVAVATTATTPSLDLAAAFDAGRHLRQPHTQQRGDATTRHRHGHPPPPWRTHDGRPGTLLPGGSGCPRGPG